MYKKEGNMQGSINAVISLIAGVGVAVLILVFIGTLSGQTYDLVEPDLQTIGVAAGSTSDLTVLNDTAVSLTHGALQSTPLAYKAGTLITGNFTYSLEAGTATLTDVANNNTAFNFTYTWKNETVGRSVKESMISGFQALEQTGSYLPIIVLAVVIALVLALVLGMGSGLGGSKGGSNSAL